MRTFKRNFHGRSGTKDAQIYLVSPETAAWSAIHGFAPQLVRDGLKNYANPQSILRAAAMLLRHIGRNDKAAKLEPALEKCAVQVTSDRSGATAAQYTDALLELL